MRQARRGVLLPSLLLCAAGISGCSVAGYSLGANIDGQRKAQVQTGGLELGDTVEVVDGNGRRLDGEVVGMSADSVHIARSRVQSLLRVRGAVDEWVAKKDLEQIWLRGRPGNFAAAGVMLGLYFDFLVLQSLNEHWLWLVTSD